jgi:nucleoside-diphosphate-sugar epimerase
MSSSQKIAVIGGSGFIGSNFCADLWHAGHYVSIADIQPSRAYPDFCKHADVTDVNSLTAALDGCEVIVNLAAKHRDDVRPISLYYDVNVTGAENTCKAAEKLGIKKIIFTSSAAVYGHDHAEANENSSHNPIGPYGDSKSKAEDIFKAWQAKDPGQRTLVIVRPTVVFGIGNRGNVHVLLNQIASGRFLMIGDGTNKKSMAYVENVSAFLCHCLKFGPGIHIFNYVDKPDLSTGELVDIISAKAGKARPKIRIPKIVGILAGTAFDILARLTGKTFPISAVRVEKFCATTVFSANRVKETAFTPPKTLREGLEKTIAHEFTP